MPNFCSCTVVGHLAKKPELRTSQSGTVFCSGTIAWNSGSGEKRKGHFLDFVAFGDTAKRIADWLDKGSAALLSGELQQEKWETQEGDKRSKHSLLVWRFENLTPRKTEADADETPTEPGADPIPF